MSKDYQYTKINIDEIKPYERNARIHSSKQVKQIMEAIKAFGFTNPLLIDDENNLIAGHGRLEAVKQLNIIDFKDKPIKELPAIIITGLSEADKKALIIADNKIAENASWDYDLLQAEFQELEAINYDLDLMGFDNLDEILGADIDDEQETKEIKDEIDVLDKRIEKGKNVIFQLSDNINQKTKEYSDLLIESGKCPTCFSVIDSDVVEQVENEFI